MDEAERGEVSGTEEVIGVFKRELDDLEDGRNNDDVKLSSIKHKVFELEEQQYMTRQDFTFSGGGREGLWTLH